MCESSLTSITPHDSSVWVPMCCHCLVILDKPSRAGMAFNGSRISLHWQPPHTAQRNTGELVYRVSVRSEWNEVLTQCLNRYCQFTFVCYGVVVNFYSICASYEWTLGNKNSSEHTCYIELYRIILLISSRNDAPKNKALLNDRWRSMQRQCRSNNTADNYVPVLQLILEL